MFPSPPVFSLFLVSLLLTFSCVSDTVTGQPLSSRLQPPSTAYFVSSSLGSDENDGRSPQRPWASLMSLTASRFQPGDVVYLCNSDRFSAQPLRVGDTATDSDGDSVSQTAPTLPPLSIVGTWDCTKPDLVLSNSSYPVISAAHRIGNNTGSAWVATTAADGSPLLSLDVTALLQSKSTPGAAPPPAIVALWVDGVRFVQARTPNVFSLSQRQGVNRSEFLYVNGTQTTNATIVSSSLASFPAGHFVNTTCRVRTTEWTYEWRTVSASSSTARSGSLSLASHLQYTPNTVYNGLTYGFYLEAAPNTASTTALTFLDAPGEFWFSAAANTLYVKSISDAQSEQLKAGTAAVDVLLDNALAAVLVEGLSRYSLSMTHVNVTQAGHGGGVVLGASSNRTRVDLSDVHISHVLGNGFAAETYSAAQTPVAITLSDSSVSDVDSNCVAIYLLDSDGHPPLIPATVQRNVFQRCGMSAGLGISGDGNAQAVEVEHTLVSDNRMDQIGYIGVRPAYYSIIQRNTVTNVMRTLNDGASYYVWGLPGQAVILRDNLAINSTGNTVSSPASYAIMACSYYLDDGDWNTTLSGNVGYGAAAYCLFLHNTRNSSVSNTTCWDGGIGMQADRDDLPFHNNSLQRNTLYRNASGSLNTAIRPFIQLSTSYANVTGWYTATGNRYCDRLSSAWQARTHLFELALRWNPAYFDNVSAWRQATEADPDDATMTCAMAEVEGEWERQSNDGHASRVGAQWLFLMVLVVGVVLDVLVVA